jgi:hypothetical protein
MKAPDLVVLSVPYPSEAWDEAVRLGYVVPYKPDPPLPEGVKLKARAKKDKADKEVA